MKTLETDAAAGSTSIESTTRRLQMSDTTDATRDPLPIEQWLQIRKEEGARIDPETAEVMWVFAQTLDPYDVVEDLPTECHQVGREYFARSPGSDIWVHFHDLPDETRERILEMQRKSELEEFPWPDFEQ